MTHIKAHFDGHVVILDEPANLPVGQVVRVIVEHAPTPATANDATAAPWKGKFRVIDERDDIIANDFKDYLP